MFTSPLYEHKETQVPTAACGAWFTTDVEVAAHELACLDCRAYRSIFGTPVPVEIAAEQITDGMALRVSETGRYGFSPSWVLPETRIYDGIVARHGADWVEFEPVDGVAIVRWTQEAPEGYVHIRLYDLQRRSA